MGALINGIFKGLALAFDNIPLLSKLKGWRTVIGYIGLAVVYAMKMKGIGDPDTLKYIEVGLLGFSMLALNAKGRE